MVIKAKCCISRGSKSDEGEVLGPKGKQERERIGGGPHPPRLRAYICVSTEGRITSETASSGDVACDPW